MPRKKDLFPDFINALRRLRDDALPTRSTLTALSGANRAQLGAFAETWVRLPVERRRDVSAKLVDLAEENIEMDFNILYRYLLDDEDAQVRAHAIDGLWEDEDSALVAPLVGFLRSDADPRVRAAAADALGRFVLLREYNRIPEKQGDLIHSALLATIRSANEPLDVRRRAVEALAYWGGDMMRDVIANAYADDDAEMRASAIAAMGRSADNYWSRQVFAELDSPEAPMRFNAARAAGELELKSAVKRLVELIDDPDPEVRSAAIASLGQIGGNAARAALEETIESEDDVLAPLAQEALDELEFVSGGDMLMFEANADLGEGEDEDTGSGPSTSSRKG
jgi:HEAT repeat protein